MTKANVMSARFLAEFMRFAKDITRADRSMAIDMNRDVVDQQNMDQASLEDESFMGLLNVALDEAAESGDLVTANNMLHPDDAPETNLHLHKLRLVFVMSLPEVGFIYLDQQVRNGIIRHDLAERVMQFGRSLINQDKLDLTADEYSDLFERDYA